MQKEHISLREGLVAIASRNFVLATAINFIKGIIYFQMFVITMPYAQKTFGASLSEAGFAASVVILGNLIGRFLSSNALSRFGFANVLWFSLIMYNVCIAVAFFVTSYPQMILQRIGFGWSLGLMLTTLGTIVARIVPQKHRGLGIGIYSMSTSLSIAFGPMLGIFMIHNSSYEAILWTSLILGGVVLLCALGFQDFPENKKRLRPLFKLTSYIDPRVVRFSSVAMLVCMGYGCIQVFIVPFALERELTSISSFFFLTFAITTVLTRPISGHFYDKYGEKCLMILIFLMTALANTLIAVSNSHVCFLLAAVCLGLGFGNFQSLGHSISISLVSPSRFAHATTTFFAFFEIANGIGPYFLGFIVPFAGYKGMFITLAMLTLVSMLLYWIDRGRKLA